LPQSTAAFKAEIIEMAKAYTPFYNYFENYPVLTLVLVRPKLSRVAMFLQHVSTIIIKTYM